MSSAKHGFPLIWPPAMSRWFRMFFVGCALGLLLDRAGLTLDPPLDYFGDLNGKAKAVKFEGKSCYKCHSSGPLAIHPARADLVSDAPLAAAISQHIAQQPLSRFYFPTNEVRPDYGAPLALGFCTKCHETDGVRQPLFKVHSHPIRVLVDFGYMPPKGA
jgi:hypothetical protein